MLAFKLIGFDSKGNKFLRQPCCYCGCKLTKQTKTREHVHPKSKGGNFTLHCCRKCNNEKGDSTIDIYILFLRESQPENKLKISNALKVRRLYLDYIESECQH